MKHIFEGTLYVKTIKGKACLCGFTWNDYRFLCSHARRIYKIKTKNKRILKKYVRRLINDALLDAIEKEKGCRIST